MKAIHAEFRRALARAACVCELRDRGYRIGLSDVERLMREHGIRTRRKRRFKGRLRTPGTRCRWPTYMLDRRFSPPAPNKV